MPKLATLLELKRSKELPRAALTVDDLTKLLKYIEDNHGWKNCMGTNKKGHMFKYMDICIDTRDMRAWLFTFRGFISEKTFKISSKDDLKKMLDWLDKGEA